MYHLSEQNEKRSHFIISVLSAKIARDYSINFKKGSLYLNTHLKLGTLYGSFAAAFVKNVGCVETHHNTYHNYGFQSFIMRPFIESLQIKYMQFLMELIMS